MATSNLVTENRDSYTCKFFFLFLWRLIEFNTIANFFCNMKDKYTQRFIFQDDNSKVKKLNLYTFAEALVSTSY